MNINVINDKLLCKQYSKKVMAEVLSVESDVDKGEITFHLKKYHCTDMHGAISVAQSININVNTIYTFAGDKNDACYTNKSGKWVANLNRILV